MCAVHAELQSGRSVRGPDRNPRSRASATFPGNFALARLRWLDASTIGLFIRSGTSGVATPDAGALALIKLVDQGTVQTVNAHGCALSTPSFSPDARFAV